MLACKIKTALAVVAVFSCAASASAFNFSASRNMLDFVRSLSPVDPGLYSYAHRCRLRPDPARYLRDSLNRTFVGQSEAVTTIISAVKRWNEDLQAGDPHPLVLAFKGPSGVGKTRMAHIIAESILGSALSYNGGVPVPKGLVELSGNQFTSETESAALLRSTLIREIGYCGGNAVIVLDEAQLAVPSVLNEFAPVLEHSWPALHDGTGTRIDCSRVVFILISDIGNAELTQLFLDNDDINVSTFHWFGKLLAGKMEETWKDSPISGKFTAVIPFLPYTFDDIQAVVSKGIDNLVERLVKQGQWASITVAPDMVAKLSKVQFVEYVAAKRKSGSSMLFAKYGARQVHESESGPIRRLQAAIGKYSDEMGSIPTQRPLCFIGDCTEHVPRSAHRHLKIDVTAEAASFVFQSCEHPAAHAGDKHCHEPTTRPV